MQIVDIFAEIADKGFANVKVKPMPYTAAGIGYQNTDTSKDAADAIEPKALSIRAQVLACFHAHAFPLTADEVADLLDLEFITVRPRVAELRRDGKLKDSGSRKIGRFRKEQIAWELS